MDTPEDADVRPPITVTVAYEFSLCSDYGCVSTPTHYVRRDGTWTGPCYRCDRPTTMSAADIENYRCRDWCYTRPKGTARQRAATARDRMQDDRRINRRERAYVEFMTYEGPDSKPPPWAIWRSPFEGTRYE